MSQKLLEGSKRVKEGYYAQSKHRIRKLAQDQDTISTIVEAADAAAADHAGYATASVTL